MPAPAGMYSRYAWKPPEAGCGSRSTTPTRARRSPACPSGWTNQDSDSCWWKPWPANGAYGRPQRAKPSGPNWTPGRRPGAGRLGDSPAECTAMPTGTGTKPMVIVGGGMAGGNAAATLRDEGFGGRVVLIGREPGVPFGRPPLSKTYLRSEEDLEGWYVGRPAGMRRTGSSWSNPVSWPSMPRRTRWPWARAGSLSTRRSCSPPEGRIAACSSPGLSCRGSTICGRWRTARQSSGRQSRAGTPSW